MRLVLGAVAVVFGAFGWIGQGISAISFPLAQRLGLQEKDDVADSLFLDAERNAARWDSLVLWSLPLAGILMLIDNDWWPYVALIAGGVHVDAGGREAAKYLALRKNGVRVGSAKDVRTAVGAYIALIVIGLWMLAFAVWAIAKGI
jgi:hypothetical protein